MGTLALWFGLLALVLTVAPLVSGIVDRAPLSFPILFLALGLLLGRGAFGVLDLDPTSPVLGAVATINLALVLFLDAARFDVDELRRDWRVPLLDLGPGTLLTIAGVTAVALLLFRVPFSQALLLGAVLASTDPIVLRDVVRNEAIPRSVRRTLTIEAGTNDIIVLPIVLIVIAAGQPNGDGLGYWVGFLLRLLVLSPLVGLAVGGVGAWFMGKADARYNIRREYQALYGIGLVLASYSLAQAVGGDGFLAAFFAGLAVALFDVTLCDCFMDYGEVSAEMAMLLAFILFGAVLSPLFATIPLGLSLLFAVIVIAVVRPLALELVLARARMSRAARAFIGWFGPRGLSALLLALLAVEARVPDAVRLLAVTGVVALVSVLVHGATATPVSQWYERMLARRTRAEEREASAGGLFRKAASEVPRVSADELARELEGANPPIVLDVRTRAEYEQGAGRIPGSVRVLPDQVLEWAARIPHDRRVVAYCT